MDTYVARGDHRRKAARLTLVSNAEAFRTVSHPEPTPLQPDEPLRLRKAVAVALLPSLMLWALIWFALTRLISNWS